MVLNNFKTAMLCIVCLCALNLKAQTITNVSPTRVTTGSIVTITGTGFTSTPSVSVSGISISNVSRQNDETVTFKVTRSNTTNNSDPFASNSSDVTGGVLRVNGSDTSYLFDYLAPLNRDHRNSGGTNNVPRITEIFTNMDGFSRFSSRSDIVNDNHELLAFTYGGVIYSTGVDDAALQQGLDDDGLGETFVSQEFKAYSTDGVEGTTNNSHYLAASDTSDGLEGSPESNGTPASNFPALSGLSIYNTLIDGVNGLELGTGITNLNQNNTVRFFSGNGQVGALGNNVPDLLLTQIAQAGARDIYYYADIDGNVVGRPIRLFIEENQNNNEPLATNRWDFYRYQTGVSFDVAIPGTKQLGDNATRPLRMIAFKLEDFAIDATNIVNINNINMSAGGRADLAFMAYNKAAFAIRSPFITSRPPSRFICELPSTDIITFEVGVTIDGEENNSSYVPTADETLSYQWYKYNSEITGEVADNYEINGVTSAELGTYRLIVSNTYGAVIVPVTLNEGGVPAFWDGSSWQLPPGFGNGSGEIAVLDEERSLRFDADYNLALDLEGCDCTVSAGSDVEIPSGYSLKLFGSLTIEDEVPASTDIDGNPIAAVPAGTLIIEDGASLVQINDVVTNENTGSIDLRRATNGVNRFDYVYWTSPVDGFDIDNIPNTDRIYEWDVRFPNTNGTDGNWTAFNGVMDAGKGYIVRAASNVDFTTEFKGVPNNGYVNRFVQKSVGSQDVSNKHWNLVGNPYPSAINADKFLDHPDNDRIEGAVYIWNQTSALDTNTPNPGDSPYYENFVYNYADSYIVYNGVGSVPAATFNGNISSGQGFFVKVRDDVGINAGDIVFRNTMRYGASETVLDNSGFYRTNTNNQDATLEDQRVWLSLVSQENQSASTLVGYVEGATIGKDRSFDAFGNSQPGQLSIYSFVDENKMVIQGRPLPFVETDMVNLGVEIPSTGIYSIGIDNIDGSIFESDESDVILEDLYTGMMYNLKDEPYSFEAQSGTYDDRFVLKYNANLLSTKDVESPDTFAYIKDKRLHVQTSTLINQIQVYDITGKLVMSFRPDRNTSNIETDFNFARGAYIVLISLDENITVSKKLMN